MKRDEVEGGGIWRGKTGWKNVAINGKECDDQIDRNAGDNISKKECEGIGGRNSIERSVTGSGADLMGVGASGAAGQGREESHMSGKVPQSSLCCGPHHTSTSNWDYIDRTNMDQKYFP